MSPRTPIRFPVEHNYDGRDPIDRAALAVMLRALADRVDAGDAESVHTGTGVDYGDDRVRILTWPETVPLLVTPQTLNVAVLVRLYPGATEARGGVQIPVPASVQRGDG